MKKIILLFYTVLLSQWLIAQNNGDYRSRQSGVWGTASNWEIYNSGTWMQASSVPASNVAIEIQSGHTITTGTQSRTLTGNTVTVNGTLHITSGGGNITVASTSTIIVNGILRRTGGLTINGSIIIDNGGTYQHDPSSTLDSNPIPACTWLPGSTCEVITGYGGLLGGLSQNFHHFKLNGSFNAYIRCDGNLTTINGDFIIENTGSYGIRLATTESYTLNIGGDLKITKGSLNFGSGTSGTRTVILTGSYYQSGSNTRVESSSVLTTIYFNGTNSEFTNTGGGTLTNTYIGWTINANKKLTLNDDLPVATNRSLAVNGTLNCKTKLVTGSGTFSLNSGATLITANTEGISSSGSTGCIRTNNRLFDSGANYTYNGTSDQVTGSGFPTTNYSGTLTIDNNVGVTLSNNLALTGSGIVNVNGILDLENKVISGSALSGGGFLTNSGSTLKTANSLGLSGSITLDASDVSIDNGTTLIFNGSVAQQTGTIMPSTIANVTIDNAAGVTLSNNSQTVTGTLLINSGKKFEIGDGKKLTVSGTLTNNGDNTSLLIKSGGSLKHNSNNVPATMERNIAAANWTSTDEGWHLLSSPVSSQSISGVFTPTGAGNDYDFYAWNEATYTWLNQKVGANNINTFGSGIGYLVAYQQAGTKIFAGNLHNADVSTSLSYANTIANKKGYNLLGNPYPCALNWAYTPWDKSNIEGGSAKIWNSQNKNYVDVILANDIIPANQGFFVKAIASGNFTIPAAARVHNAQGFYKNTSDILILKAEKAGTPVSDVMGIRFNAAATLGYDAQYDASEFETFGDAPSLYAVLSTGEKLSINSVPELFAVSTIINLDFIARTNGQYTFKATSIPVNAMCNTLILEDTKTNIIQNLNQNPNYSFNAATTDNANRFKLHFQIPTGIEEQTKITVVYIKNGNLTINSQDDIRSIEVYNYTGQLITKQEVNAPIFNIPTKDKIVLVRIITDKGSIVRKVIAL